MNHAVALLHAARPRDAAERFRHALTMLGSIGGTDARLLFDKAYRGLELAKQGGPFKFQNFQQPDFKP